jgi:hypothetical protein
MADAEGLVGRPRHLAGMSWYEQVPRKVRAPQGRAVGNTHPEQSAGQCHREQTAGFRAGKGETVVQETTSGPGDRVGSANPARSKVEQRTLEGCPPECAGGPHEAAGNGGPRWMVAERSAVRRPGTEPGLQTSPSA